MQNYHGVANGNPEFVDNRAVRVPQQLNCYATANGNPEFVDSQAVHGPQHLKSLPRVQELRNKGGKETQAAIIPLGKQAHLKNRTTTLGLGHELTGQRISAILSVADKNQIGLRRSRQIARSVSMSLSNLIQPLTLLTPRGPSTPLHDDGNPRWPE